MPVKSEHVNKHTPDGSLLAMPFIGLIRGYQLFISPMLGQNCRFYPTCSCYAQQALKTHGLAKGTLLALKRIGKCHPMHPGGIDNVPERKHKN